MVISMDAKLNYEGTGLIDKERKSDLAPIEMKTAEEIEAERQRESEQIKIGEAFLWGNRVVNPNEPAEDESYRHTLFESEEVKDEIKESVAKNLDLYMAQDVSIVEVTNTTIHKKEGYESEQNKKLAELATKYSDTSLKKRKAALKDATKIFAKIDEKKKKLLTEKDPYKQLAIKLEIVDLKAKALSERAKAYGRDKGVVNDELANIAIAANYEKKELYNRRFNEGDSGEEGGEGLVTQDHQKMLLQLTQKADKNIKKIADRRRRHRGLEIFDAAYKKRMSQRKDRDEQGRIKADVRKNAKQAEICKEALKKSGFGGPEDSIKDIDKAKEEDKKKKSFSRAIDIQNSLSDFTAELNRDIDCLEKGELVNFSTRSLLSLRYSGLIKMCDAYLGAYKVDEKVKSTEEKSQDKGEKAKTTEEKTQTAIEKACYDYVKKVRERLTGDKEGAPGFAADFSVIFKQFITYKIRTPFKAKAIKEEEKRTEKISKEIRESLKAFMDGI